MNAGGTASYLLHRRKKHREDREELNVRIKVHFGTQGNVRSLKGFQVHPMLSQVFLYMYTLLVNTEPGGMKHSHFLATGWDHVPYMLHSSNIIIITTV